MKEAVAVIIGITSVIIIAICLYTNISDFAYVGAVNKNIIYKESNISESTFKAKKGDNIKFNCSSLVKEGSLKLTLSDSSGKVIRSFESDKDYSEQVSLENDGEYIFLATYDNFIGNFHVKFR